MIYNCNICNFKCNRKVDYNRHLLTKKHNKRINNILPINSVDDDCGKKNKNSYHMVLYWSNSQLFLSLDSSKEASFKS